MADTNPIPKEMFDPPGGTPRLLHLQRELWRLHLPKRPRDVYSQGFIDSAKKRVKAMMAESQGRL
jgi:hypothetical protein